MKDKVYQDCSDYELIAWLIMEKGVRPVDTMSKKIRRGLMKYYFDIDEETWVKYRIEFKNSLFSRYLLEIKLLKDPSF